jgi:hypothetical protein
MRPLPTSASRGAGRPDGRVPRRAGPGLSKAEEAAISDGADLNQIVNAHRSGAYQGMTTAEGVTRRGVAGKRLQGRQRLTVGAIQRLASDRAEAGPHDRARLHPLTPHGVAPAPAREMRAGQPLRDGEPTHVRAGHHHHARRRRDGARGHHPGSPQEPRRRAKATRATRRPARATRTPSSPTSRRNAGSGRPSRRAQGARGPRPVRTRTAPEAGEAEATEALEKARAVESLRQRVALKAGIPADTSTASRGPRSTNSPPTRPSSRSS